MRLFQPYLERRVTEEEKEKLRVATPPEDWDIGELWDIPEEEWMGVLEDKAKVRPELQWFLPPLRIVERMCCETVLSSPV
jgi:hypothetical protein